MTQSLQEQLAAMLKAGLLNETPPARKLASGGKKIKVLQRALTTTVPEDAVQNTGNPPTELHNDIEPLSVAAELTKPTDGNGASGVTVTPVSNDDKPAEPEQPSKPLEEVQTARTRSALTLLKSSHAQTEEGLEHLRVTAVRANKMARAVVAAFKGNRKPEVREAVANAEWVANATRSMYEARKQSDLDAGDISTTRKVALAKLQDLDGFLSDPDAGSVETAEVLIESVRLEHMPDKYFAKYRRYASRMPNASDMRRKGLRFKQVTGMPLTVIFRNEKLPASALVDEGFEVSDDGGYITLLDQTLWAINISALDADPNWQKGPTQKNKAISAKVKELRTKVGAEAQGNGDIDAYLDRLLVQARKRVGTPFVLMGAEGHQRINHSSTPGIAYYWVMPVREQAALPSPVEGFGLPF
jgi:hypothetical protein